MTAEPELIPQPHGGALLAGGKPGNKGGPGRPKEELREKLARLSEASADELMKRLESAPETLTAADLASIMDKGAKFNLATKQEFEDKTPSPEEAAKRIFNLMQQNKE